MTLHHAGLTAATHRFLEASNVLQSSQNNWQLYKRRSNSYAICSRSANRGMRRLRMQRYGSDQSYLLQISNYCSTVACAKRAAKQNLVHFATDMDQQENEPCFVTTASQISRATRSGVCLKFSLGWSCLSVRARMNATLVLKYVGMTIFSLRKHKKSRRHIFRILQLVLQHSKPTAHDFFLHLLLL